MSIELNATETEKEDRDFFILKKPYEKKEGTACFAPYVKVSIAPLVAHGPSQEVYFDARIDTGADITCIPRTYANMLGPLILGNPIRVRGHDGSIKRVWTYRMKIALQGYPNKSNVRFYRPEKGVLITDSDIGLIGMDIISNYWKLSFDNTSHDFSVLL